MPPLGAHCSVAGGYYKAVEEAHRVGCDVVQISTSNTRSWAGLVPQTNAQSGKLLTKNNSQWRAKPIGDDDAALFAAALRERKIDHPISHASYLINLASPDALLREKSIEAMVVELARADQLGIPYVIVHPGAHTTVSEQEGITLVAASVDEIHRRLPRAKAQVTLELTAGQGTCLGCSLTQLAAIVGQVKRIERVGVCVDTCHAFAAGTDLRDRKVYLAFWREFDRLLGLGRLKAVHLNDSKRELGSRVDRHEHIGRGQMGPEAFRNILQDKRLKDVPMYLETPKGDHAGESWDVINLRVLRQLAKS